MDGAERGWEGQSAVTRLHLQKDYKRKQEGQDASCSTQNKKILQHLRCKGLGVSMIRDHLKIFCRRNLFNAAIRLDQTHLDSDPTQDCEMRRTSVSSTVTSEGRRVPVISWDQCNCSYNFMHEKFLFSPQNVGTYYANGNLLTY